MTKLILVIGTKRLSAWSMRAWLALRQSGLSFDEIVVDTVRKSSPVPAPPAKFVRILSVEGILFGFPE